MKNRFFVITIFTSILFSIDVQAKSLTENINDAQKEYQKKNYSKAFEGYKQAQIESPENPRLKYNLGNTAYKLGKYDDAINIFKNLSESEKNPELKEKSLYNLGNSYYRQSKLEDAEKAYLDALKIKPDDLDAKKNLEKVREEMKKREQQQQDRKNNQGKNKDKKNNQKKDNEGNKNQDKNNPDKNKQSPPSDKNGNKPKGNPENKPDNKDLKKDEAEKWLNSLKDNNQEILKNQILKKIPAGHYSRKDW